jgi:uncharacterized repeat protein (TIGR01451 family)
MMGRRRLQGIVVTVGMAFGVGLLCSAMAAAASPAWRIDALSNTTAAPGGTLDYLVQVTNVGGADSDGGQVDLVATLPAGVTALSTANESADASFSCTGPGGSAVAGASVVTCAETGVVPAHGFRTLQLTVDPSAAGSVTSLFQVSGGGAAAASTVDPTTITATPPGFGVDAFDGQVTADPAGDLSTQAAGHPFAATTAIDFNTVTNPNPPFGPLWPVEPTKDVLVDLPAGFIADPLIMAQCTATQLANAQGAEPEPLCPPESQVGTTLVRLNDLPGPVVLGPMPVFNMAPAPDGLGQFGFNVAGTVVMLDAQLRSESDDGLTLNAADVPQSLAMAGMSLTLWGVPSDRSHDAERACPGQLDPWRGGPSCPSGAPLKAFLRNPTFCAGGSLPTTLNVDSWTDPGVFEGATVFSHLPPAYPSPPSEWGAQAGPTGCGRVPFDPSLTAAPTSTPQAGQPVAFAFDVRLPQSDDPAVLGEADLEWAAVTLPEGVRVSPVGANGFGGCSPAEIGLDTTAEPTCPDASKIGSATITTPLLSQPLTGSVYLATPNDNPFGSALAIYLVAKGPGLIVKLPWEVDEDPDNGQLTVASDDVPQLPLSHLQLQLSGGPHGWMTLPDACGTFKTYTLAVAWSGSAVASESDFDVNQGAGGGPCPVPPAPPPPTSGGTSSPGPVAASPPAPFAPTFAAGTANPAAGASAPFHVQITRTDRDQQLGRLSIDLPTGLLGRIAGTVLCPDGAATAGACPGGSKIGDATLGAGTSVLSTSTGSMYLTGPYKGAPFGLSIVVPAAGPFGLGSVVVRAAIDVDRRSAQLHVSDALPTSVRGVALDVRELRVAVDKPRFVVNPTSCGIKHVLGTVGSVLGAIAHVSTPFQVAGCAKLAFAPKLTLAVGAAHRTKAGTSTPLSATLTQTPGQTNLRSVTVRLPNALRAVLPGVKRACSLASYDAGRCPAKARVGLAVAVTPLLREPLWGRVYFVKNPARATPDLMVALRGPVSLDLTGKVSISRRKRLTLSFDTLPDAPITTFKLRLGSGRSGPLRITSDLCAAKSKAATTSVRFRGQDGRVLDVRRALHVDGCRGA